MGASQGGVLAVDEGVVGFAVPAAVGDHHFDVLAPQVDGRVERFLGEVVVEQVEQTVLREKGLAVELHRQPRIEVGVAAEHGFHELVVVGVVAEYLLVVVGNEAHPQTVSLLHTLLPAVRELVTAREADRTGLAVAHAADGEFARKGVDRLHADTVQSHRLAERGAVLELAAGVHFRHRVGEFVERDAAAVVADGDPMLLDVHLDGLAVPHHVFVDGVVHHLLDEHVHAVVGLAAVAEAADVHARSLADVFVPRQRLDAVVVVTRCVGIFILCHGWLSLLLGFLLPAA